MMEVEANTQQQSDRMELKSQMDQPEAVDESPMKRAKIVSNDSNESKTEETPNSKPLTTERPAPAMAPLIPTQAPAPENDTKQKQEPVDDVNQKPKIVTSDESTGVIFEGKELEVLWILGPLQVWWDCTAKYSGKLDRKGRHIYNLMYNAKPEHGYPKEKRPVVFAVESLVRDQYEKQMMQYRWAGDTTVPPSTFSQKDSVIVQSIDDPLEWLGGIVDGLQEDGTYSVVVGKSKVKDITRNRLESAPIPKGFPSSKTSKYTERFFNKVLQHYLDTFQFPKDGNAGELVSFDGSQKKTITNELRLYKNVTVAMAEKEIGYGHDSIKEYVHDLSYIDVDTFVTEKCHNLFAPVIKKKLGIPIESSQTESAAAMETETNDAE